MSKAADSKSNGSHKKKGSTLSRQSARSRRLQRLRLDDPSLSLNFDLTALLCCLLHLTVLAAAISDAETSHNLKGGESVEWKLRGSIHHGRIITKLTEPTMVNDSMVAASVKEPKWLGKRAKREMEERKTTR